MNCAITVLFYAEREYVVDIDEECDIDDINDAKKFAIWCANNFGHEDFISYKRYDSAQCEIKKIEIK